MIISVILAKINNHWWTRFLFNLFLLLAITVGFMKNALDTILDFFYSLNYKKIITFLLFSIPILLIGCQTNPNVTQTDPVIYSLVKDTIKEGCPLAQECRRQLELVCKTEIVVLTGITIPIVLAVLSYAWKNWNKK